MTPSSELSDALDRLDRSTSAEVKLGLERMRALLAALDDPQAGLPAVLVAGTNGKGSVATLLASFALTARYRTGLYTSPHLESVEECFRIDGEPIPADDLARLLHRVLDAARTLTDSPTRFEALTAAALLRFAEESVELAVLEVGLGGRLDAVNAAEPRLSVVTSVDLDHREHLGATLAEIAREKAGVFRPGAPAVIAAASAEAREVLVAEAEAVGARPVIVPRRMAIEAVQRFRAFADEDGPRQRIWMRHVTEEEAASDAPAASDRADVDVYELVLAGRHQADNLAVAVVAAEELRDLGWEKLTRSALRRGARACRLAGRLEEVTIPDRAALPGGGRVLLDVAHNPAGAAALALALRNLGEPVDLVFGTLADKDAVGMLAALAPQATRLVLTTPPGERGRDAATLRDLVPEELLVEAAGKRGRKTRAPPIEVIDNPGRAIEEALRSSEGRIVVACGSVVLVGAVRGALRKRYGVDEVAG